MEHKEDRLFPEGMEERAARVLEKARKCDCLLATAESCTAGLLAALLTDVRGESSIFEAGFVTYSDEAKTDLLGVDAQIVKRLGAVSREVAVAMAEGALERSRAKLAISVTGFAGPAGEDDEEGLVFLGLAREGMPTVHREEHYGPCGRSGVRFATLETALAMLDDVLA